MPLGKSYSCFDFFFQQETFIVKPRRSTYMGFFWGEDLNITCFFNTTQIIKCIGNWLVLAMDDQIFKAQLTAFSIALVSTLYHINLLFWLTSELLITHPSAMLKDLKSERAEDFTLTG